MAKIDDAALSQSVLFDWRALPKETCPDQATPMGKSTWTLTLDSGRVIRLQRLSQSKTYAGLLEGLPQSDPTGRFRAALEEARALEATGPGSPLIIAPQMKTGQLRRRRKRPRGPEGETSWYLLPPVRTIALVDSLEPIHPEDEEMCSSALLIWFSDDFGLPIQGEHITREIQKMSWAHHAWNWDI